MASVLIIEGSDPPPGAGSVIAKDDLTSPLIIGSNHLAF